MRSATAEPTRGSIVSLAASAVLTLTTFLASTAEASRAVLASAARNRMLRSRRERCMALSFSWSFRVERLQCSSGPFRPRALPVVASSRSPRSPLHPLSGWLTGGRQDQAPCHLLQTRQVLEIEWFTEDDARPLDEPAVQRFSGPWAAEGEGRLWPPGRERTGGGRPGIQ